MTELPVGLLSVVTFLPALGAAVALVILGGTGRVAGIVMLAAYAAVVLLSAAIAALRFRSAAVGLATAGFLPPTHVAYALAFMRGFVRG